MKRDMNVLFGTLLAIACVALVACGGDGGGDKVAPQQTAGEERSRRSRRRPKRLV